MYDTPIRVAYLAESTFRHRPLIIFSPEKSSYTSRQLSTYAKMPSTSGSRSSKRLEVFQNIGFVIIGQFLEWLHFGSTLVAATAKEILCPSSPPIHQKYDNENGQNNKRFHSRFLVLVVIRSLIYGFASLFIGACLSSASHLLPTSDLCVYAKSSALRVLILIILPSCPS